MTPESEYTVSSERWKILRCGVCHDEHWHNPKQSEVICLYCESWANEFLSQSRSGTSHESDNL